MTYRVSVLGAGAHGHQLAAILSARAHQPVLYDDHRDGFPPINEAPFSDGYVIGAAWPHVRQAIASRLTLSNPGEPFVFPGAHIGDRATLGAHTHVEYNAVVSHGCQVGPFVTICPGAVLAGEVTVGEGTFIGANATIIHGGITIGANVTVGAGAVVTRDVPDGWTVAGVPARRIK